VTQTDPDLETATSRRSAQRPRIQSVARAMDVLIEVARSPRGLTSRQITEQLGTTRQGTYHLLHTLTTSGFLTRTGEGRYALGLKIGTLAAAFPRHLTPEERLAPYVRALAAATDETAYAAGWQGDNIVVLSVARGNNPVQATEVVRGTADDGHARASGKLLLAHASNDLRDEYLRAHPLRRRTERTITDLRRFLDNLEAIRQQGYAIDEEEFADGLCCLAVPLDRGASPFVIGVSVPAMRFRQDRERILETTLAQAHDLSRTLTFESPDDAT
jgi:IclR family transcriptional regulator, acetate operon repressor